MLVEQLLQRREPAVDLVVEVGVLLREQRSQALEADPGAVDVGLEVPQVGARPVLLLTGDLARRDLVQQAAGPVGDLVGGEGEVADLLLERGGVLHEVVGVLGPLGSAQGLVALRPGRPEILLEPVPAGPGLTLLEVGLAEVHLGVEVAERLGHRLDPLPVHPGPGVELARLRVVARLVGRGERVGLRHQLLGLVLDVGRVVGVGGGDELAVVAGRGQLLTGVGDGEGRPDAVADHPGLAGGEVGAGRRAEDQVTGEARPDVLDLADDAEPVGGEQVELGHLRPAVGDGEGQASRGRGVGRDLAARVGGLDGEGPGVARLDRVPRTGRGVVGAGGQQGHAEQGGDGGQGEARTGTAAGHGRVLPAGRGTGAGAGWCTVRPRAGILRRNSVIVGTT